MEILKICCCGLGACIFCESVHTSPIYYKLFIRYCAFHLGNFKRAEEAYRELLDAHEVTSAVYLYIACCYFYQQMFEESEKIAEKGPDDALKIRLLFNIAHRTADENKLMTYHQKLKDKKCAKKVYGSVSVRIRIFPLLCFAPSPW